MVRIRTRLMKQAPKILLSGTITINGVSYSIQEFLQAMQSAYS